MTLRRAAFFLIPGIAFAQACILEIPDKPAPEAVGPPEPAICDTSCYEGSDGTADVGLCKRGAADCVDGAQVGACNNQVLPALERCDTQDIADEDCNGRTNEHCATTVMSFGSFGTQGVEFALPIEDDVIVVIRNSSGRIGLGDEQHNSPPWTTEWLLARLDPAGEPVWAQDFEPTAPSTPTRVAGLDGDVSKGLYVVGQFADEFRYAGDVQLTGFGAETTIFVTRLDAADGTPAMFAAFGDDAEQLTHDVVALEDGVIFVGEAQGTIDFGAVGQLAAVAGADGVIAKLDRDLVPQWARLLGGAGDDQAWGVAVDGAGRVVVAGRFADTLDLGGPCAAASATGETDAFVASLDGATGDCNWVRVFAGSEAQRASALTVADKIYVALAFSGTVSDGTGWEESSTAGEDMLVAVLDPDTGMVTNRRAFGGEGDQYVWDLATDAAGRLAVVGSFNGDTDFGGGLMDFSGPSESPPDDGFVLLLDASLDHVFSRNFSADQDDDVLTAHFLSGDELLLTGEWDGSMDFGTGVMNSDEVDGFLLRLPLR